MARNFYLKQIKGHYLCFHIVLNDFHKYGIMICKEGINITLNLVSIIFIIISLFVLSLTSGGIKILVNKFFNFDSPPFLWLQYSLFYVVSFFIYIFVSIQFPNDNKYKFITFIGIVVAEILLFYFRYYILESKLQYALFITLSTIFYGMYFYIFYIYFAVSLLFFA